MRIQRLAATALLGALWTISMQAQSSTPFNLHIGGGIGVPLNPTSNFAGISGTFQVGAGPNIALAGRIARRTPGRAAGAHARGRA